MVILLALSFLLMKEMIMYSWFKRLDGKDTIHHQQPVEMDIAAAPYYWPEVPAPVLHRFDETESIEKQIPVVQYRSLTRDEGDKSMCIVCMNIIDATDGVRELKNCSHVFHGECLDLWIGKGHVTCPLCRSELFPAGIPTPANDNKDTFLGDPWRAERMIYLFGVDCLMQDIDD